MWSWQQNTSAVGFYNSFAENQLIHTYLVSVDNNHLEIWYSWRKCIFCVWFQALIFADGILMAGSMEALIQHLVPTDEYNPDVSTPVIYHLQFSSILIILHLIWLLADWTLKLSENSNICNFCCCFVENLCVRLFAELSSVYPTPWPDQWSLSGKYLHLFFYH